MTHVSHPSVIQFYCTSKNASPFTVTIVPSWNHYVDSAVNCRQTGSSLLQTVILSWNDPYYLSVGLGRFVLMPHFGFMKSNCAYRLQPISILASVIADSVWGHPISEQKP